MKRIYVLLGLICLYVINRFLLLPWLGSGEVLYRFLSGYGADVLAGAWILCFLNLLLVWSGRQPVRRMVPAVLFVLGCGLFWEYITPLYLAQSVSDPLDVAAYLAGGIFYMMFEGCMDARR